LISVFITCLFIFAVSSNRFYLALSLFGSWRWTRLSAVMAAPHSFSSCSHSNDRLLHCSTSLIAVGRCGLCPDLSPFSLLCFASCACVVCFTSTCSVVTLPPTLISRGYSGRPASFCAGAVLPLPSPRTPSLLVSVSPFFSMRDRRVSVPQLSAHP